MELSGNFRLYGNHVDFILTYIYKGCLLFENEWHIKTYLPRMLSSIRLRYYFGASVGPLGRVDGFFWGGVQQGLVGLLWNRQNM